MRKAFGDVHMLSHMVGAANRADIRRLCRLEEENAALSASLSRSSASCAKASPSVTTRFVTGKAFNGVLATPLTIDRTGFTRTSAGSSEIDPFAHSVGSATITAS